MSELTDFLLARIAEDEAVAKAAANESPTPWADDGGTLLDARRTHLAGYAGEFTSPYIARHDPARVLADYAAQRRIVELHRGRGGWHECPTADRPDGTYAADPCDTLRALASVYAGEPGWREEWA